MSGPNEILSRLYPREATKVAEETKTAEAELEDFLGRAAAHAAAQEWNKIASGKVEVQPERDPAFEAAAEKVAMDILHVSGFDPFTLKPYANDGEKTAAEQKWAALVQQAQGEQEKAAAEDPGNALVKRAWEMLDAVGFEPTK